MNDLDEALSPGWEAIDAALARVYGGRAPDAHFGTMVKFALGGPDPIDGVSVYRVADPPHLHYVSYGFTELYGKETDDPATSGYGFELTFRLAHRGEDVPIWPIHMMQNLARYVFKTGNVFSPGHHVDANGPLQEGADTCIRAVVFAQDPALPEVPDGPFGAFRFVQMVGIAPDELAAVQTWSSEGVLALLEADNPLRITDMARASKATEPAFAAAVAEGIRREGTAQGAILDPTLQVRRSPVGWEVELTARAVKDLVRLLRGRIPFGRGFSVLGGGATVTVAVGQEVAADQGPAGLRITLDAAGAERFAAGITPRRGVQEVPGLPRVRLVVRPFVVRDRDGNVVSEEG